MLDYESGKQASIAGVANEHIVLGILLPFFPNAMLSSHQQSTHDLIIPHEEIYIRAQVKTSKKSISFTGGSRAGIDRTYMASTNNPKTYTYSTKDTDIIIGIKPIEIGKFELFFIPSLIVELSGQKSISTGKVAFTKNNFDYLKNCTDKSFCLREFRDLITE